MCISKYAKIMHSKTQTLFIVYLHFCRVFVLCVNTWSSLAVWWRISWFVVRHFQCSCNVYLGQGRSWDRRIQPKSWTPGNILLQDAWYFKILFLFIIIRKKLINGDFCFYQLQSKIQVLFLITYVISQW